MRKSILKSYFGMCVAIIAASIISVGSVLLMIASRFYVSERRDVLAGNVNEVLAATQLSFYTKGGIDTVYLNSLYKSHAVTSKEEFTLVNAGGACVVCSEPMPCSHTDRNIPAGILNRITEEGDFSTGNLDGIYSRDCWIQAVRFNLGGRDYYIFGSESAEPLAKFQLRMIKAFLIVTAVILVIVSLLVYWCTLRLVKPLKQMIAASERFGKGDFSQKIKVDEDNEIGILANSMNDMAYSLSKLEDTRRSFVANVSHELKTPMTTIGGFVDGILDGTIPKEQHRHYLTVVSTEVSRLARMVRSMLNIAKYETGEMELKRVPFDMTALVIETVLLFEKKIEDKRLDIIGLDTEPHFVNADRDLVQQVIYNLAENAVKFVNEGGAISFKFTEDPKNHRTEIAIRNTGEGLTQEELPKVFDRFYKTDESHGKDKTGVGLGLSIVRSIIHLHNSKMQVRSTYGEYTEFSFVLDTAQPVEFRRTADAERRG